MTDMSVLTIPPRTSGMSDLPGPTQLVPIKCTGSPDGRNVRLVPTWTVLNHLTEHVMSRTYFADNAGIVWVMPEAAYDPIRLECPEGMTRVYTAQVWLLHYTPGYDRNARIVEIGMVCRELARKITDRLNAQHVYYGVRIP